MVVLNCYGKIDKICISTKLGLYLSNLLIRQKIIGKNN